MQPRRSCRVCRFRTSRASYPTNSLEAATSAVCARSRASSARTCSRNASSAETASADARARRKAPSIAPPPPQSLALHSIGRGRPTACPITPHVAITRVDATPRVARRIPPRHQQIRHIPRNTAPAAAPCTDTEPQRPPSDTHAPIHTRRWMHINPPPAIRHRVIEQPAAHNPYTSCSVSIWYLITAATPVSPQHPHPVHILQFSAPSAALACASPSIHFRTPRLDSACRGTCFMSSHTPSAIAAVHAGCQHCPTVSNSPPHWPTSSHTPICDCPCAASNPLP